MASKQPKERELREQNDFRLGTRPVWWKACSQLWQARLWLGKENGGAVSLGLYRSEFEAGRAFQAVVRELTKPGKYKGVPQPLAAWQAINLVFGESKRRLPRWVRRFNGEYRAQGVFKGELLFGEQKPTPEEAFLAFWPIAKMNITKDIL